MSALAAGLRTALAAALLAAGACAAAAPQRIVSMVPALTESVCVLGACARLVGTDRYSNWPPEVAALPRLGGLDDAQVERIAALKPDLVLIAPSARAAQRLQALGLQVVALHTRSHQDVRSNLLRLGDLLGEPARAQAAWAAIEQQMAEAAARVPPAWRGRSVYFEVDAGPYAAGPDSFIGQTLQQLQLANIVPAALGPFPKLSPEFVVRAQPQVIVADERQAREMAQRPGWAALPALRQRHLCAFPAARYDVLVRPGPRMGEAALLLADCVAGFAKEPR